MPGLLDALSSALEGTDIAGPLSAQLGLLQGIGAQQQALGDGPPALGELTSLLGAAPGFDFSALGGLGGGVSGLPLPADLRGPLQPLLTPLEGLIGLQVGFEGATGKLDLVRRVIEIAFRRAVSPDNTLPVGLGAFGRWGLPTIDLDLDEARQSVQEAIALFGDQAELGPERLLELARRVGGSYDIQAKWPRIPGLSEAAEALQTTARWEGLSGAALTAELTRSTGLAAQVIALPRTRVVEPITRAAGAAAAAPASLTRARAALLPLLEALRPATFAGAPSPGQLTLDRLEAEVGALEALTAALDLERGPLSRLAAVPADLELSLLRTIRAVTPSSDGDRLVSHLRQALEQIPAASGAVFDDVLRSIQEIDLSALTEPLGRIRDAVQAASDAFGDARDGVRQALEDLLRPVDEALAALVTAAGLDTLQARLQQWRDELDAFVQTEVVGRLQPIQDSVTGLVDGLSTAVSSFDPAALLAPIQAALDGLAAVLAGPEVLAAITTAEQALTAAVQAIEQFTLKPAADTVIADMNAIEEKVGAINPAILPDAAKDLLRQGVATLTDIDFTGTIATPIVEGLATAIEEGPGAAVSAIRGAAEELSAGLADFNPSEIIGDELQAPFDELVTALRTFRPSDLLRRVQDALDAVVSALSVDGLTDLLTPLEEAHAAAADAIAAMRPSVLLRPVDEAIERAVAEVLRSSGVDAVLDGVVSAVADINAWLDVAVDARDALHQIARVLEAPIDTDAVLDQLIDSAMDRLADADITALAAAQQAAAEAAASIRVDVLHAALANAVRAAVDTAPTALASDDARRLKEAARAFPLNALRALPPSERRRQLVAQLERLLRVADQLDAAAPAWQRAGRLRDEVAAMPPRLETCVRVFRYDGDDVFSTWTRPITSAAELQALVRPSAQRDLRPVLQTAIAALRRVGPHVAVIARGLGDVLVAAQSKLAELTGPDGVGGVVSGIDSIADQLRTLDLSPITGPLDAVYGRIEGAWAALDPAGLRALLEGIAEDITALLDVSQLVSPEATAQLDTTYTTLVDHLEDLSPRAIVAATLDPLYTSILEPVQRLLALPAQLEALIDGATTRVPDETLEQLGRVEQAFDAMLRALPLGDTGSASASVSVG